MANLLLLTALVSNISWGHNDLTNHSVWTFNDLKKASCCLAFHSDFTGARFRFPSLKSNQIFKKRPWPFNTLLIAWNLDHYVRKWFSFDTFYKVEKVLKGSLDSIPSLSPSVKIQIMGGKVCLRCRGKTLLGIVNKLLKTKSFWGHPAMFCLFTSSKL